MTGIEDWTPGQLVLRALIVAGPLVALLASSGAGTPPSSRLVVVVGVLSLGFAAAPGSWVAGSTVLVAVVLWWGLGVDDPLRPAVLIAAAGLLVAHVAATLADYGPSGLGVDVRLAGVWTRRSVLVFLAAPGTWWVALAVEGQPEPAGLWVTGVLVVVAAALTASWALTDRLSAVTS